MFIIAQIQEKCNTEAPETGMNEVIRILQENGRLHDLIAAEILKGSNEKAIDILRACNCKAVVPGTSFAPLNSLAQFYNCNPRYILTLLNRFGLTPGKTPSDVLKCGFSCFLWEHQLEKRFAVSCKYSTYTMIDRKTGEQYEFNHSNKAGNLYSARVVLAVAMLMYFGRTINPEAKGNDVYNRLLNSTYADNAREILANRREKQNQPESNPEAPEATPDDAAVLSDGKITMSADFMAGLIKTAVHEAVAEFSKTLIPAAPAVTESPAPAVDKSKMKYASNGRQGKMVKPENWDTVLAKYQSGEITRKIAAAQTGMCVATFSKYSKGISQFYNS